MRGAVAAAARLLAAEGLSVGTAHALTDDEQAAVIAAALRRNYRKIQENA